MHRLIILLLLFLAASSFLSACGDSGAEQPQAEAAVPLFRDPGFYGINSGIYDIFMTNTATHPAIESLTGDFSFETRIKFLQTSTSDAMAGFTLFDDGAGKGYNIGLFPNQDKWIIYDVSSRSYLATVPDSAGIDIGRWHKLKAKVETGRIHIFIDDVRKSPPEGYPLGAVSGGARLRVRNANALFDDVRLTDEGGGTVLFSEGFDSQADAWQKDKEESWARSEEQGNSVLGGSVLLGRDRLMDPALSPNMKTHFDQMDAAGVHSIRVFFHWSDIQAEGPEYYYWDYADVLAIAAHDRGMSIIPSLTYAPTWAVAPEVRHQFDSNAYPPLDNADYSRFVTAFVERYKPGGELAREMGWRDQGGMAYYELGHEFNVSQVFKSNGEIFFSGWLGTLDQYLDLLKAGHDSVKRSCGECLVLNGAVADDMSPAYPTTRLDPDGRRQYVWQGVEDLFVRIQERHPDQARPAEQYFDILNIHTYEWFMLSAGGQLPDKYRAYAFPDALWYRDRFTNVNEVMERHGYGDMKIWVTETSYASASNGDAFGGHLDEAGQAQALRMIYEEASHYPRIEKVFWWYSYDTSNHVGLIRKDLTVKPSYDVYSQLTGKAKN